MKKLLILFVLPLALLTSCGSTDDLANQIIDAIVSFGEASAKIDGVSTELNNYAGYRTSDNITSIYFSDIKFDLANTDLKGEAILCFLHSDLVTEGSNVNISISNIVEIGLNPKMAGVGILYLSNVSAKDLYDLVSEYNNSQSITNVIQIAGQKDVDVKQASVANILEGYINFSFSKVSTDKLSGTFSFKAFNSDNESVEVTEGTFTDTPRDTTNL
ncbi:hypothetical protein [Flammeovirga sp. SJP92]|uniref:hypothetical protein n=1 Tax=Flammeovirga sp. SJP92 TaxID=1775430 RepID=UPI0007886324|nr:hypothetical protein [Flammeovirga sp. SJP92]KXX67522.1 hypothetical protein AVL50_25995 [Flammeovirga sp. SJP92]